MVAAVAAVTSAVPLAEALVHQRLAALGLGDRTVRTPRGLSTPEQFAEHLGVAVHRVVKVRTWMGRSSILTSALCVVMHGHHKPVLRLTVLALPSSDPLAPLLRFFAPGLIPIPTECTPLSPSIHPSPTPAPAYHGDALHVYALSCFCV